MNRSQLKYYSSLLTKSARDSENKFLVEGEKLIIEALNSEWECETIIVRKDYLANHQPVQKELQKFVNKFEEISEKEFRKIQATENSQGIIGVFKKPIFKHSSENIREKLFIGLDEINDPGNVGTIFRNADWFGLKYLLLSANCADVLNPKTLRASAGSIFHLNWAVIKNYYDTITSYKHKGYKVLCADISGTNIYNFKKSDKNILIFSNEANGPSNELLKLSDEIITIPRKGKAESLNVASASAVILSELTKYPRI
ncbi:MAG: RNA methyltransferase [Ignavibacteriaceae bacterium]|nr:RNA methyltransferase [Ignavibacteriaceae bacterium]